MLKFCFYLAFIELNKQHLYDFIAYVVYVFAKSAEQTVLDITGSAYSSR